MKTEPFSCLLFGFSAVTAAITIAIPFYRQLEYLQRAVLSVQAQDCPDWQLIVSADGNLVPEAGKFVESLRDSRIRYVPSTERLGMVRNWNRCLDLAETELVTLLHEDDLLESGYVSGMLRGAAAFPEGAAYFCRAQIIDSRDRPCFSFPDVYKRLLQPGGQTPYSLEGETGAESLMRGNYIFCPTLCYRQSRLQQMRFDPRWKMVQDFDLILRLLLQGETIVSLPDQLYRYRRHSENATEEYTQSLLRFEEEWQLHQEFMQAFEIRGWCKAARRAGKARVIKLNLLYCGLRNLLRFRGACAVRQLGLLWKLMVQGRS